MVKKSPAMDKTVNCPPANCRWSEVYLPQLNRDIQPRIPPVTENKWAPPQPSSKPNAASAVSAGRPNFHRQSLLKNYITNYSSRFFTSRPQLHDEASSGYSHSGPRGMGPFGSFFLLI